MTDLVPRATVDLPALKNTYDEQVNDILGRLGAPSSNMLKVTQSKQFVLPDGTETGGPLPFVIVDFVYENRWYDTAYNRNNVTPPACAALAVKSELLVPFDDSPDKRSDKCTGCPENQFGTGQGGRGKACTNAVLIALLDPMADPGAPLLRLRTSPTGIAPFESYIRQLGKIYRVPFTSVLTFIGFDANVDYSSLRFGDPKRLDVPDPIDLGGKMLDGALLIQTALERQAEARELLLAKPNFEAPAAKDSRQTPVQRGASRRATA